MLNNLNRYISHFLILIFILSFPPGASFAQDISLVDKTGYDVWTDLTEGILTQTDKRAVVKGVKKSKKGNMFTFGGEKEGSSSLITRVMGPDADSFREWVDYMPEEKKKKFLRKFLAEFSSGRIRIRDVVDKKGNPVPFDLEGLRGVDYSQLNETQLMEKLDLYLERGGDKHFSHVSKGARQRMFKGTYGDIGSEYKFGGVSYYGGGKIDYDDYVPLHGKSEKFISAAHGTSVGWEMNFKPQKSYGEFEHMIEWFRDELHNGYQRFEAPGHQWIVFPKTKKMLKSYKNEQKMFNKLGEIYKNTQAYIVLKSIEGNAGIEMAEYKDVQTDSDLIDHDTGRGVIRLEDEDYRMKIKDNSKTLAIEYRAGVKNNRNRRKTQKFLISRFAAQEFGDIADADSYELFEGEDYSYDPDELARRFDVSEMESEKFWDIVDNVKDSRTTPSGNTKYRSIKSEFLIPF